MNKCFLLSFFLFVARISFSQEGYQVVITGEESSQYGYWEAYDVEWTYNGYPVPNPTSGTYKWTVYGGMIEGEYSHRIGIRWLSQGFILYEYTLDETYYYATLNIDVLNPDPCTAPSISITSSGSPIQGTCTGGLELTAKNGSNYEWRINSTTSEVLSTQSTYTPQESGRYYLTGRNSCSETQNTYLDIEFIDNVTLSTIAGSSAVCTLENGTTDYNSDASKAFDGVTWSISNAGTSTINSTTGLVTWDPDFSGLATITVTAEGCGPAQTASKNVDVSYTPPMSVTLIGNTNGLCPNGNIRLYASVTNNPGDLSFEWKRNGGTISTALYSLEISASSFSDGDIITCQVTTGETCIASSSVLSNSLEVDIDPPTSLSISSPGSTHGICAGDLELTANNGSNYEWRLNSTTSQVLSTQSTYTPQESGRYYLTGRNSCGETGTAYLDIEFVDEHVSLSIITGSDAVCPRETGTTDYESDARYATRGVTWSISNAGASTINSTTGLVTWDPDFSGRATITITAEGCDSSLSASKDVDVSYTPPVSVIIEGNTTVLCPNGHIVLYASVKNDPGDLSFEWKKNGSMISTIPYMLDMDARSFHDGDIVTCEVTTGETCVASQIVLSNSLEIVEELPSTVNTSFFLTQNQNYILTSTPRIELQKIPTDPGIGSVNFEINFFDGLGRSIQGQNIKYSPFGNTIVESLEYDAYGRLFKTYLPYSDCSANGRFVKEIDTVQSRFYSTVNNELVNDDYPFAITQYEQSPLSRILSPGAPGADWQSIKIDDRDLTYHWQDFVANSPGGTGEVKVIVEDNVLKVDFSAGFAASELNTGPIKLIGIDIPDLHLGYISSYSLYVKDGYLSIGDSNEVLSQFFESFQKDLSSTAGNTIRYSYQSNNLHGVILWRYESLLSGNRESYQTNKLYETSTTDENNHTSIEYTNIAGQIVLKKSSTGDTEKPWAETYYIYDDFDQLRLVLPPAATDQLDGEFFSKNATGRQVFLDRWAFQYDYDGRRRMIKKKVPGADTLYMVYDNRDRLILTQDGEQREKDEWLFTKYDALNRPILTGIYDTTVALTQREMQAVVDAHYSGSSVPFYETLDGNIHGYTNVTYPPQSDVSRYLSATYYDDYGFQGTVAGFGSGFHYEKPPSPPAGCQAIAQGTYCYEAAAHDRVKGQVTGTKVKILGTDHWINTVTHYDDRYRVIQTVSTNTYLGVTTRTSQLYNFPGWLLGTYKEQAKGGKTLGLRQRYTYDHVGRLLQGYHELYDEGVGQGEVLLAENRYNELGELIEKNLHVEGGVPAQSLDYRYNIRGWLESINKSVLSDGTNNPDTGQPKDYFGMDLWYQDPLSGVSPAGGGN